MPLSGLREGAPFRRQSARAGTHSADERMAREVGDSSKCPVESHCPRTSATTRTVARRGSMACWHRYISAFPPSGAQFDNDGVEVVGVIRFRMPEDEVDLPLWDDHGLLPAEPELLKSGLGISAALIADLLAWGAACNDRQPRTRHEFE